MASNDESEQGGGKHSVTLHAIGLAVVSAAIWLLLSGHFEPLLLFLGVVSVTVCVLIALRMDLVDHESVPTQITWNVLRYIPWLAWEVVKANIDVAKRIIDPKLPISPTMFETPASQKSDLGHMIYANSITLTPGTVSMDLEPGRILVHALSREGAADIQSGEMDRRVAELESG